MLGADVWDNVERVSLSTPLPACSHFYGFVLQTVFRTGFGSQTHASNITKKKKKTGNPHGKKRCIYFDVNVMFSADQCTFWF